MSRGGTAVIGVFGLGFCAGDYEERGETSAPVPRHPTFPQDRFSAPKVTGHVAAPRLAEPQARLNARPAIPLTALAVVNPGGAEWT